MLAQASLCIQVNVLTDLAASLFCGQVETDEMENKNGKLKFGNGRQNSSLLYQDIVYTGV